MRTDCRTDYTTADLYLFAHLTPFSARVPGEWQPYFSFYSSQQTSVSGFPAAFCLAGSSHPGSQGINVGLTSAICRACVRSATVWSSVVTKETVVDFARVNAVNIMVRSDGTHRTNSIWRTTARSYMAVQGISEVVHITGKKTKKKTNHIGPHSNGGWSGR